MKFTYDKDVDAAYIYLKFPIKPGEAKNTVELKDNIVLDFDENQKLIGVEILDASKMLSKEVLMSAKLKKAK